MTFTKTKLVLGIATAIFTLTGAMVSPQAVAKAKVCKYKGKVVKCKKTKKYKKSTSKAYVAPYVAPQADNSALQSQVDALNAKVNALENKPAPVMPEPVAVAKTQDNMVFFRGGYANSDRKRDGVSIQTNAVGSPGVLAGIGARERADNDAWYFGAGLDFSLNDNLFGLMDKTEVLGEIMFEYKEFNDTVKGNALATTVVNNQGVALNGSIPRDVTVSQFTLTASPKIKFMKGSDFRPWLIPFGFSMNVISPPSESITVMAPGVMFGGGADYKIWKNLYIGADARYHLIPATDGVNPSGFTAGGYLGIGF